jgi:hypothetical protein
LIWINGFKKILVFIIRNIRIIITLRPWNPLPLFQVFKRPTNMTAKIVMPKPTLKQKKLSPKG